MDERTLKAYSTKATEYSQDWLSQPEPSDMYDLIKKYFIANQKTADIGCGNGRDTYWMHKNGFKTQGFDASSDLLKIASADYPEINFSQAFFPESKEIDEKFDNILCETVIMHLPSSKIPACIASLKRILNNDGILYLSWRVTEGSDMRHNDGRLYSAFEPDEVLKHFAKENIIHFEDKISASSGKRVCRLIYRHKN